MKANNEHGVVKFLEEASTKLFKLFSDSLIKSNVEKSNLLVTTNKTINKIENFNIKNSHCEKLLGVTTWLQTNFL